MPKISVIIPCYNMGNFVQEAIDSVIEFEGIEIIIINDGSDDDGYTKLILDSIDNKNITVLHQENKGLGNARNTGVSIAKSPYLAILDSDNKLRHDYLKLGISILETYPEIAVVYGDNRQFGLNNRDVVVGDFDITRLLKKNYIDACVILRKEAWESIGGYDEKMPIMGYEDWDLNLRLFFNGWEFRYVNRILYDYRVRENSMLINSNKNRDVLNSYIFSKPDLYQASLLRGLIISNIDLKNSKIELERKLKNILNSRMVKIAIKFSKIILRIRKFK